VIAEAPGETWLAVAKALIAGSRGLAGGTTLARLLAKHRGVRNHLDLPRLSVQQIVAWAKAHRRRTGVWPTWTTGPIRGAPGETWANVASALTQGLRGLPRRMSLARLLGKSRHGRNRLLRPRLTVGGILAWADAHHRRTGAWPHSESGPVVDAPGETWLSVNAALRRGDRGLPGGSSLSRLLKKCRGGRPRRG
jgi:hypothetical protein